MRTELHRVRSDCYKLLFGTEGKKEETLELVVPDRCGDIVKILDVRGQLFLSSKKLKDGEAELCSRAELCVIFSSENGEIEYVPAQLSIEQSFTMADIPEDCQLIANVRMASLDARALNPRKLLIRVECCASVCCYAPDSFTLWDGFCESEAPAAYIQRKELSHNLITDMREKSFTISDEYSLPAKYAGAKMLSAETELCVYDSKPVGNKLVFKVNANTTALFLNPEDDSLFKCDFTTQFSQIIEIEACEETECIVLAALKETEFVALPERELPCFSMRLTMLAQAMCVKSVCSVYVSDAYSTSCELNCESERVHYWRMSAHQRLRIPLKGKLPFKGDSDCVIYLAPIAASCRAEGARVICTVQLCGIGQGEESEPFPIKLTLSAEEALSLAAGEKLLLHNLCCEPVCIEKDCDVSLVVTADFCVVCEDEVCAISALEFGEACSCEELPALTVLITPGKHDTWTLAKKYRSTEELIIAANRCGEDFDVCRRPLLIPRA